MPFKHFIKKFNINQKNPTNSDRFIGREGIIIKDIQDFNKETTLIIGDSLTSDIKGGNNLGIKTCWYNPKRKTCIEGIHVDYEIHDLLELLPIVNQ